MNETFRVLVDVSIVLLNHLDQRILITGGLLAELDPLTGLETVYFVDIFLCNCY